MKNSEYKIHRWSGSPKDIAYEYSAAFKKKIMNNLESLLWKEEVKANLSDKFRKWTDNYANILQKKWPWLLEEMKWLSEFLHVDYEDIFLMNMRAWWGTKNTCDTNDCNCSTMALKLSDGSTACLGAIDDGTYYCEPVVFIPDNGYRFIHVPFTGTSWVADGMNSEGLVLVQASPGYIGNMRFMENTISLDLADRIILQTCSNVDDVRAFCTENRFNGNLTCVDRHGKIFCAHNTEAGLFEINTDCGYGTVTNHTGEDEILYRIYKHHGVKIPGSFEHPTTRLRRGRILDFLNTKNGKCTQQEVFESFGQYDEHDEGSILNSATVYMLYANPQVYQTTAWIRMARPWDSKAEFMSFSI